MPDSLLSRTRALLLEKTESTNALLMKELSCAQEDFVVCKNDGTVSRTPKGEYVHKRLIACTAQTAGRGRLGRTFYSAAQKGIYVSLSYVPTKITIAPAQYTVAAAVGVCRAIKALYGIEAHIKWVNDIFINGKKVCGILTEGVCRAQKNTIEALVIGIGINIFFDTHTMSAQEKDLVRNASGIENELSCIQAGLPKGQYEKKEVSCSVFLARLTFEILHILDTEETVIQEYRARSLLKNQQVTVTPLAGLHSAEQQTYRALVLGITDDAGLTVKLKDGSIKTLYSGEVSLHTASGELYDT